MKELEDKTALITGSGQGIGQGIALELAVAGAEVCLTHLPTPGDEKKARAVVDQIDALGRRAFGIPMDITDPASIRAGLEDLFQRTTRLDIVVNNAGVMQQGVGLETQIEDFDRCYAVNLKGIWHLAHAVLPHFKARRQGRIVNIVSTAGRRGVADLPAYCASKAAAVSLTQSMAAALGPSGINVNAVCPGIVWTPMSEQFARLVAKGGKDEPVDMKEFLESIRETIPLRRIPTAKEIGHAVVFFASDRAKGITGQALNVDGGFVMS